LPEDVGVEFEEGVELIGVEGEHFGLHIGVGIGVGTGTGFGAHAGGALPLHVTQQFWLIRLFLNNHDASKNAPKNIPGTKRIALLIASPRR
jgi:hypothetical protein